MGDEDDDTTKPRRGPRHPSARLARRVAIESLLANDVSPNRISRIIAEKFDVSDRMVRKDVVAIRAERELDERAIPAAYAKIHRKRVLEDLYQKCIKAGNFAVALATQDKLCRIDGVYAAEVLELPPPPAQTSGGRPVLTSQNVRGRIVELLDKARGHAAQERLGGGDGVARPQRDGDDQGEDVE